MVDREDTGEHLVELEDALRRCEADGRDMTLTRQLLARLRASPEVDTPARGMPALEPAPSPEPTAVVPMVSAYLEGDPAPAHTWWTDPPEPEQPPVVRDHRTRAPLDLSDVTVDIGPTLAERRRRRIEYVEADVITPERFRRVRRTAAWALSLSIASLLWSGFLWVDWVQAR